MKTPNPPVEIMRAQPEDAEAICDIRDRTWLNTYPNEELGITVEDIRLNAQGLNGEFVPRRIAWLQKEFSMGEGSKHPAFVAKVDNAIQGYVSPGIDADGRRMIHMMYVQPEAQNQGIGSKLMEAALEWLGDEQDIYLNVASYNDNAINFYKRFGFEETGNPVPDEDGRPDYMTPIPEIEMIRKAR